MSNHYCIVLYLHNLHEECSSLMQQVFRPLSLNISAHSAGFWAWFSTPNKRWPRYFLHSSVRCMFFRGVIHCFSHFVLKTTRLFASLLFLVLLRPKYILFTKADISKQTLNLATSEGFMHKQCPLHATTRFHLLTGFLVARYPEGFFIERAQTLFEFYCMPSCSDTLQILLSRHG